jgi:hypothetical protein
MLSGCQIRQRTRVLDAWPSRGICCLNENGFAMEQSLAHAQEKIAKLELEIEDLRTALSLIYETSQDRITPKWEVIEHIAATAEHALNRNAK